MLKEKSLIKGPGSESSSKADLGFSLIELLIVVSLIGVLSMLGMPLFRDFVRYSALKNDGWRIVSDFRSYRQLSIIEHVNYAFVFNIDADSYTIEKRDSTTNALIATIGTVSINNDITQADNTTFMPKGQAGNASTISIQGENPSDRVTISVFATTGLAKMTGP